MILGRPTCRPWLLLPLCAAACLVPTRAVAYEDAWLLEAGLGGTAMEPDLLGPSEQGLLGAALSLGAARGLDDAWSVRLRAEWTPLFQGAGPLLETGAIGLDFLYAIDLLEVVPYAGLGAGAMLLTASTGDARLLPTVRLALGLDWLLGWSHVLGLEVVARMARGAPSGRWSTAWGMLLRWGLRLES